jgi:Holliday junction resolvasome RuvABC DNA-binding subunit
MVYFRELPVPLREIDPDFLEIIFNFANTFTEESVLHSYAKHQQEEESKPTTETMRRLGYSEEDIAKMELRDGTG